MQHISCNLPLLAAHAIKSMALRRKDPNLQAAGNLQSSRTRQLLKASVSHDAHRHKAGASVRQGSEPPPSPRARPPRGTDPDFHDNSTLPCSPSSTRPSYLSPVVMLITAMGKLFWAFGGFDVHTVYMRLARRLTELSGANKLQPL